MKLKGLLHTSIVSTVSRIITVSLNSWSRSLTLWETQYIVQSRLLETSLWSFKACVTQNIRSTLLSNVSPQNQPSNMHISSMYSSMSYAMWKGHRSSTRRRVCLTIFFEIVDADFCCLTKTSCIKFVRRWNISTLLIDRNQTTAYQTQIHHHLVWTISSDAIFDDLVKDFERHIGEPHGEFLWSRASVEVVDVEIW